MKYTLRIDFTTGNSYYSEDVINDLEMTWENLDVVKANLNRIREHYYMIEELENFVNRKRFDEIIEKYKNKDWFVADGRDSYMTRYQLNLKADNGNDIKLYAFWIGHFDQLHSVEIVVVNDDRDGWIFEV